MAFGVVHLPSFFENGLESVDRQSGFPSQSVLIFRHDVVKDYQVREKAKSRFSCGVVISLGLECFFERTGHNRESFQLGELTKVSNLVVVQRIVHRNGRNFLKHVCMVQHEPLFAVSSFDTKSFPSFAFCFELRGKVQGFQAETQVLGLLEDFGNCHPLELTLDNSSKPLVVGMRVVKSYQSVDRGFEARDSVIDQIVDGSAGVKEVVYI